MTVNDRTTGAVGWRHSISWVALLLLCASLLVLQVGCGESASTVRRPAREPSAGVSDAQAVPDTPAEHQTGEIPAEPVAVEATVLTPKIKIDKTSHDFGDVGPETKHSTQFTFENVGRSPLKITRVQACCGSITRGVRNGQEYAPGETGTLELDWHAGIQPGVMRRTLYLHTNDSGQSTVALKIQANVVRRVEHAPQRLRLFLRQENGGCEEITLKSLDGRPFSIRGFRSTASAITAEFDPEVKATEFVLKPKANMARLERNLKGQVSIDLTHPECRNVRLLYDVVPEFTVNPPQLMMFNLKADQPVQREIWILSNYRDEFEIESVESQKGTIEVVDLKKVNNRYQLRVEITPPAPEGERSVLSEMLEVKIRDGQMLQVPFRGFY